MVGKSRHQEHEAAGRSAYLVKGTICTSIHMLVLGSLSPLFYNPGSPAERVMIPRVDWSSHFN